MSDRIGVIGVGRMGSQMAKNLLDGGYEVVVFDVDEDRMAELGEAGADTAASSREIVETVDVVLTSLPRDETVEEVYLGSEGIVETATDGMALVETSTVRPATVEAIADAVDERGLDVDVVDAPVIGIPSTAAQADLTVLVGGTEAAFDRVAPLADLLGTEVVHVGPVGRAKAMKLVNNVVTYGNYAVAAEVFALADALDLDREELFDVVDSGPARSSIVASKLPKALERDFEPGFTVDGACKDLRYALDLARRHRQVTPIAETIAGRYEYAAARDVGDRDYSILFQALADDLPE